MISVRKAQERGVSRISWLDSRHTFSFSDYYDPQHMGFRSLRVINDDRVAPAGGFGTHGHRDMEIITYVRRGAISHADSLGNEGRTEAGSVQVMSAGTGIEHAEWNREAIDTELFQIWVEPDRFGLKPRWATAEFPRGERAGRLVALASGEKGIAGATLAIHQDATLYGAELAAGLSVSHQLRPGRVAYLVAAEGALKVNGAKVACRDGVAIRDEEKIGIEVTEKAELLLFDLPA